MKKDAEKRIAARLAETMAMLWLRNTNLETLHAAKTPVTWASDWSDMTVVDADATHAFTSAKYPRGFARLLQMRSIRSGLPIRHSVKTPNPRFR